MPLHFPKSPKSSAALLLCGDASLPRAQTIATLDEVVVTASRAVESRREVTSNVIVIVSWMKIR